MKIWIVGGLTLAAGIAACSGQVSITAEKASGTQGAGGAGPSGTSSTSNAGSGSTGAGGSGPGLTRVVTADTDIGQYVSIPNGNGAPGSQVKLVDGPFFVTDAIGNGLALTTVQGGDCNVPGGKHVIVMASTLSELHGMRLPILAGQSLCAVASNQFYINVLGFKPY